MSLLESFSEDTNWLTIVLALVLCLAVYMYIHWSKMPPGPIGFPYLGYYPYLSEDCHLELLEMSKKYGEVFCFRYTGQLYAHVIDMKTVREISTTKSDCFERRPAAFTLFQDIFSEGIFQLNGEEWKVQRKFFMQQFKEFGMGKAAQEGVMHDCLKKIVTTMKQSGGKNFNGLEFFGDLSSYVIQHLIFAGVKLDQNEVRDFNKAYTIVTDFSTGVKILLAGPFLKYVLMPFKSEYRTYRKYRKQVDAIVAKIIRQHERTLDRNNIRNMVDSYINQRKLLEEKKDPKSAFFPDRYLAASVLQFFGDGTLGVAWFVSSILKSIATRPDIQKAVQSEIDEVVGRDRFPSMDDRSRLSFLSGTVYEGIRTTKFFPLLPTLECTKETTLGGCRIPKGTIPVYNMHAVFFDPKVYSEPEKFDPTRYFSTDGKKPKAEIPVVFGVGKRSCIGESFATMQIILYVATVLQNYDLHPVDETEGKADEWQILLRATPRTSK